MEIEKTVVVPATANRVWELLLDPQVMGECVPGMQSIQVISDLEYVSEIKVKVAFVSAKFKLRTTIVEQRAPNYLRTEGTGEDKSVASSLKQVSEIFLTEQPDGQTQLRILVNVDVLGRLGTFGLSALKTKADRMWDEFTGKLVARISSLDDSESRDAKVIGASEKSLAAAEPSMVAKSATSIVSEMGPLHSVSAQPVGTSVPPSRESAVQVRPSVPAPNDTFWSRWFGRSAKRDSADICIEIRRDKTIVKVLWPVQGAGDCSQWLREYLMRCK